MSDYEKAWSLLSCPFCGGKPTLEVVPHLANDSYNQVRITCTKCHAMACTTMDGQAINGHVTETSEAIERAVASWNRRTEANARLQSVKKLISLE